MKVEMAVKNGLVKSGYDLKGAISQRQERTHGGKEGEKREREKQQQHFLKRKRRQDVSASNGTKAGYT